MAGVPVVDSGCDCDCSFCCDFYILGNDSLHGRGLCIQVFRVVAAGSAKCDDGSHLDLDLCSLVWSLVPWNSRVSCLLRVLVEESVQDLYCPKQRKSVQAQTRMEVAPLKAPC